MNKRFLFFSYEKFSARGGFKDFLGGFNNMIEFRQLVCKSNLLNDTFQIADLKDNDFEIIYNCRHPVWGVVNLEDITELLSKTKSYLDKKVSLNLSESN